jgi:hypothetical protein
MRLLMDSVTVASPGNIQLRDELARSVEEYAPEGSNVVLLMSPGHCKVSGSDKLRVVNVEKPGGGWIGRWKWYHRILPQIAREHGIDVLYSLSGILSKRLCESLGRLRPRVCDCILFFPKRGFVTRCCSACTLGA